MTKLVKQLVVREADVINQNQVTEEVALFLPDGSSFTSGTSEVAIEARVTSSEGHIATLESTTVPALQAADTSLDGRVSSLESAPPPSPDLTSVEIQHKLSREWASVDVLGSFVQNTPQSLIFTEYLNQSVSGEEASLELDGDMDYTILRLKYGIWEIHLHLELIPAHGSDEFVVAPAFAHTDDGLIHFMNNNYGMVKQKISGADRYVLDQVWPVVVGGTHGTSYVDFHFPATVSGGSDPEVLFMGRLIAVRIGSPDTTHHA